jgi:hypothetical protein
MALSTAVKAPNLPLSVEEIDAAWLTSALHAGGRQAAVRSASIVNIIKGTSTKIRIALEYDEAGQKLGLPATMILKGGFDTHSPGMSEMFRQEARFYEHIAPHVALNVPKTFFAGTDPDSWQAVVLMEDLNARNVHFCRAQEPFDYPQIKWRLEMLAALHAKSWDSPDIKPGGRWESLPTRFDGWSTIYNEHYLQPEIWQSYIDSPRGAAISRRLQSRDWMHGALARLGLLQDQEPNCLIHGDTHPGNLYIDADGTPGFLDAIATRACWWLEVTYHIVAACDIADRRNWEGGLLSVYLAALAEHGVTPPDFDHAWLRYRQSIAYGLFIFIINETKFQTESTNTAYTARFGNAAIEHDTIGLLAKP